MARGARNNEYMYKIVLLSLSKYMKNKSKTRDKTTLPSSTLKAQGSRLSKREDCFLSFI